MLVVLAMRVAAGRLPGGGARRTSPSMQVKKAARVLPEPVGGAEGVEGALGADGAGAVVVVEMGEDGFGGQAEFVEGGLDFVA